MPQKLYFAEMDGEVYGPYTLDTIREIHLMPDILVLATMDETMSPTDVWHPASNYPELQDSLLDDTHTEESEFGEMPPVPSFDSNSIFYIKRGELPYGPYNLEALASAGVSEDTLVSLDGMVYWYPVRDIIGLSLTLDAIINQPNQTIRYEPINIKEVAGNIIKSIYGEIEKEDSPYRLMFQTRDDELNYVVREYGAKFDKILHSIGDIISLYHSEPFSKNLLTLVVDSINNAIKKFESHYNAEFVRLSAQDGQDLTSVVPIGRSIVGFEAPFENLVFERKEFIDVLGPHPLLIIHEEENCAHASDFINSIAGRLYNGNIPRTLRIIVIDLEELNGLSDAFKVLNRDIYKVVTAPSEARDTISELQSRISNIIRNILVEPSMTLRSYNVTHETKEPFILLVVKNFPSNIHGETLNSLRLIAKNGFKAGVCLAMMMAKRQVDAWDETARINEDFNLHEFMESAIIFDFTDSQDSRLEAFLSEEYPEEGYRINKPDYDTLSIDKLRDVVYEINCKCELKEDVAISLQDYLPDRKRWWRGESSSQIEIPFGLSSDRISVSLKITQESGQNSVVVIGIPGSGKSVFLHSFILNAAFKYSPDELRMYLIDFSGVEFDAYARGKLPHARVIAPEAEREFGISILREIEEEGSRRMELCRNHKVSNIVELKRVAPGAKVPRLLVIIDEFQKLFDDTNDKISQEANAKIHIIIQEFRKFGINLILATQQLPSSSILPRDLIANRVVFKCTPADFQTLITWENIRETPRLRKGECIYNSESGASYDNTRVQSFWASMEDIDNMLAEIDQFQETFSYTREPMLVFRSGEQPDFAHCRMQPEHRVKATIPGIIPVYLGESIAINDTDVCIELVKENNNNILIIGGESVVAERIAYNSVRSAINAHEDNAATVVALNGMRADNLLWPEIDATLAKAPCNYMALKTIAETETILNDIKNEIDTRRNDENAVQPHIFIVGFDFQSLRAFDLDTSSMITKPSICAKHMAYIISNGPAVGVFSILQTDSLVGISRIDSKSLDACNYRIALQMPENASMKIMDSYAANKLLIPNRPASRYRAYMRDNLRNISVKFKPYK